MANEQNLIPNHERTPSELREITTKGGIESGKARRRKKALRTALKEAVENCTRISGQALWLLQASRMRL